MKKLKLNKAKLAFDMLEKEMSVISKTDELKSYVGGQQANDCVIAVFNSLDGASDSSMTYQNSMMTNLGYNTYSSFLPSSGSTGVTSSTGLDGGGIVPADNGVKREDIATVGSYGGLSVTDMQTAGSSGSLAITAGGKTISGDDIMITFNSGDDDHAVILTGVSVNSEGVQTMTYYDPQNNNSGSIVGGAYSGMYSVGN